MYRELIVNKLKEVLMETDNPYKKDFEMCLDCNMTPLMKKEFIETNKALDRFNKEDTYDLIVQVKKDINDYLVKPDIKSKKHLAMLAVDNILKEVTQGSSKEDLKNNLNKFVKTFFPEFANLINIELLKSSIKINNIKVKSDDMFMDVLLLNIAILDKAGTYSSLIISNEKLNELETRINKKLTKLEAYMYLKLEELDSYLMNRDLEIVNYAKFTNIFKFSDDEDIYIDHNRVFEDLFLNDDFVNVCNDIATSKKIDKKMVTKLETVLKMMNMTYYDANFKLVTSFNMNVNSELGSSNDETIYLNLANLNTGLDVLNTFFHEYRHLIQSRELKKNNGIYNEVLYSYIDKQCKESPFGSSYGYCTYAEAGYRTDVNYDLQPLEFDAENFAKYMLTSLSRLDDSKIRVKDSLFNVKYAKKYKHFSNKKLSLEYYDYYYKLYKVDEVLKEEEECHKALIESLSKIDDSDPEDIFTLSNFDELDFVYKKELYKKMLFDKKALLLKDEDTISINGKVLSIKDLNEYEILEQVLTNNALYLAKKGEISMNEINDYIYNESLKYKVDVSKLDTYNLYRVYLYHNTFNKYRIKSRSKTKVKSK
jgi:hypothetical protein